MDRRGRVKEYLRKKLCNFDEGLSKKKMPEVSSLRTMYIVATINQMSKYRNREG